MNLQLDEDGAAMNVPHRIKSSSPAKKKDQVKGRFNVNFFGNLPTKITQEFCK